ncbi:uncharacterized protein LOC126701953 isoform X20 [Quercus robur]|uniref:uncharacterized protein LOC126701953 isoform X19 n=1 Tax=Quercus robur TaxID=38942 RepID=UPI002163DBF6|nr:uncharacterized protein LOC126701953 isoform X19 [Quercus robur]XP_050256392.1 uncharacterized protein LOC126701953 isoform X20 [Quercus robur]
MGVLFSVPWKKKTPAKRRVGERIRCPKLEPCIFIANSAPIWDMQTLQRHEQQVQKLVKMGFDEADVRSALEYGNEISAIKMLRFAECAWAGNDTNTKLWQPDEQQVQKLVEMGFAEAAVGSALEAVNGDEILAIKMLCFEECGPAGIDTYRKLWQPDEQQVQKLAEMGFAEAAVRSALEAVNGDEILAIKMLRFADCGPAGIETYRKLWQPDEQRVQKLVEMGFAEAAVRCSLEAVNGDEILAIKMLRFAECARAGNDTNTKLWQPDEQQVQKYIGMGFAEAAVRSALEAVNGDEILAIKMLRFEECARAGNDTNTKLWQPNEQQVQKYMEMGFAEAAVRSALEAVNGNEILAIKMLCFAECGPAGIDTYRKLWQPDEQRVQKLVEMGFAEATMRSALEAVNGDEILAIKMLRFAEFGPARINTYRKLWRPDEQRVQKLAEMGFAEAVVRSALEAVNGDEILAIKMLRFAQFARAGNSTNTKPDEQRVQKLVEMGFAEAAVRSALEAVNGVEILAIKMLRFAECARAGNDTNTKLWQPDEQQVQKLVEKCCDDAAGRSAMEAPVRSALEAVNGDEKYAITMLLFAARVQSSNDIKTKEVQNLVAVEVLLMLFIICLFFIFLLNSEAVNGDEILAFKLMK